ncbi:HD domain-containing protein [Dysgonomonas sp. 521]|uniref:HD domain-containing protein n=1 Tax=Dysgonomonas sp. 521 TaxID=2302932 RepID=UPI0013D7F148|nr:HD domain-containing protein [Dysgonomonas sp. 521]
MRFNELLKLDAEKIIFPYYKEKNGLDGLIHIKHVVHFGELISRKECPQNINEVILGCYLHDIGRGYEINDETHGDAGELIARRIMERDFGTYNLDIEKITYAVKYHDKGFVSNDPVIGAIWDADRLSLYRFLGKIILLEKLSTKTTVGLRKYAKKYIEDRLGEYNNSYY